VRAVPRAEAQVRLVIDALPFARRHGVGLALGPSAPHRCSDTLLQLAGAASREHAIPLHTH
jgi:cytosine/adenosine deaminase-related metal-dependent hydrolase